MAINEFETKDYLANLKSKVTYAFEDAPVFNKYLQLMTTPSMEIQAALQSLMQQRSIDTALGAQLDIIGDIVGQPRELIDTSYIPYFGFDGAFEAQSYGDVNNTATGGYYWDIDQPLTGSVLLNDDQYRLFIKAKIIKNITSTSAEDVIRFIKFVFNADRVQVTFDQGASATIIVSNDLSLFEVALLRYFVDHKYRSYFVPKSLGVKYNFGSAQVADFFSYAGVEGAMGYGTYLPPTQTTVGGGVYASLY